MKNYIDVGIPKKITEKSKIIPQSVIILVGNKEYNTTLTNLNLKFCSDIPEIDYCRDNLHRRVKSIILTFEVDEQKER